MGGKQLRLPAKGRKDVPTIQDHKDIIDRDQGFTGVKSDD